MEPVTQTLVVEVNNAVRNVVCSPGAVDHGSIKRPAPIRIRIRNPAGMEVTFVVAPRGVIILPLLLFISAVAIPLY